jgi:hypothetical protein
MTDETRCPVCNQFIVGNVIFSVRLKGEVLEAPVHYKCAEHVAMMEKEMAAGVPRRKKTQALQQFR